MMSETPPPGGRRVGVRLLGGRRSTDQELDTPSGDSTGRRIVRARYFVAVLLALALSAALFCAPAGSATQARVATAHGQTQGDPSFKEGSSPSGGSTGDDDRWGNTNPNPNGTGGAPGAGTPRPRVPAPTVTGNVFGVRIDVRMIPGFVVFVVTLR
jgi:hypothetical protein